MADSASVPSLHPSSLQAVLVSACLIGILLPLNSSMIVFALPEIKCDFNVAVRAAVWLVTASLFTVVALHFVAGKLGDRKERCNSILGSLGYFGFASLVAPCTPNPAIMLFARVQQAVDGAFLATNGLTPAFEIVLPNRRDKDLGLMNAALVLTAARDP